MVSEKLILEEMNAALKVLTFFKCNNSIKKKKSIFYYS